MAIPTEADVAQKMAEAARPINMHLKSRRLDTALC